LNRRLSLPRLGAALLASIAVAMLLRRLAPERRSEVSSHDGGSAAPPALRPVANDRGEWGYIDASGVVRIEPRFRRAEPFAEGLAAVEADSGWGFVDEAGRVVIEPKLHEAQGFSEGRAPVAWGVASGERRGFIDRRGDLVELAGPYDDLGPLREGIARACRQRLHVGFIERNGRFAIEPRFDEARNFHEGFAAVAVWVTTFVPPAGSRSGHSAFESSLRWGYVQRDGSYLVTPRFTKARDFHDGRGVVQCDNGLYGYVDRRGDLAVACELTSALDSDGGAAAGDFGDEGLAWAALPVGCDGVRADGSVAFALPPMTEPRTPGPPSGARPLLMADGRGFGYADLAGRITIAPKFGWASPFAEGLAAVVSLPPQESEFPPRSVGFIDARGELVIAPAFDPMATWLGDAPVFSGGRAAVMVDRAVGFIDRKGRWIVGPRYESAGCFREALAPVKREGRWGFVDREGHEVIEPRFDAVEGFSEGRAAVATSGAWGFVDAAGRLVIPAIYESALPFRDGLACVRESTGEPGSPGTRSSYIDRRGKAVWVSATDFCSVSRDERPCLGRRNGVPGW